MIHKQHPDRPGALCDGRRSHGGSGPPCRACARVEREVQAWRARVVEDARVASENPARYRFPGGEVLLAELPAESPEDEGDGYAHAWTWGARVVSRRPRSVRDGRFLEAQATVAARAGVDFSKPSGWRAGLLTHWLAPSGPVPTPSEEGL